MLFRLTPAILAGATIALAQDLPRRIADLSPPTGGTVTPVKSLVDRDGTLFFNGWDAAHGEELWRSDGTPVGTLRVADGVPGPGSSSPADLVAVNGILFFTAHDVEAGWQLWRSDGTPAGTYRVTRTGDGTLLGKPVNLKAAGGKVFFEGIEGPDTIASRIWCSDGTAEGTHEVQFGDLDPTLHSGIGLQDATVLEDHLFFVDQTGALWGTDGTAEGSRLVWQSTGVPTARASGLQVAHGLLHFIVTNAWSVGDVWESDGTAAGTRIARWWHDGMADFKPSRLMTEETTLLVEVSDSRDDWHLVVSDGTAAGTAEAMRAQGDWPPLGSATRMARCGGGVLYAGNSVRYGQEPWFSNGKAKGTRLFKNLMPDFHGSQPHSFTAFGKLTLFIAAGEDTGREVWVTGGPGRGARPLADVRPGPEGSEPSELMISGDRAFWVADDGVHGFQLWASEGRLRDVRRLTELPARPMAPIQNNFETPGETLGRDGVFYFAAGDEVHESVLWSTDGTPEGTWKVTPPSINRAGTYPNQLTNAADRILYHAWDGVDRGGNPTEEIWMTDGSPEGTAVAFRVSGPDAISGWQPRILGQLGGVTLLEEQKFSEGRGLWRIDGGGLPAVPVMPGDAAPGAPGELVYFSREEAATGNEPWVSDGTLEGTRLLKNLLSEHVFPYSSKPGSYPQWLGKAGGKMLFSASINFGGRELMVTDGTSNRTFPMWNLQGLSSTTYGTGLEWNGNLFFMSSDNWSGTGLWRSDGTVPGTVQVKQTSPFRQYYFSAFDGLVEAGGKLYFTAGPSGDDIELWVTDGTPEGTRLVHDIRTGPRGSFPQSLAAAGGRLYFSADDGRHGRELWCSDGTAEGTVLVHDIAPGWEGSFPKGLTATGGKLFFQAWTQDSEVEPYVIDQP